MANSEDVRAFVIAAGCAALVAGCGGGSTTTTTVTVTHTVTRTRTVTAENAPTTTTTAAAPCLASALAGTFTTVPGSAGAGQITYRLRLTNQGDAACYVAGVPEGRLVGRDGRTLPTNIGPAKPSDSTAGRAVITPGGAATADARFSPDVPGTGDASGPACEPKASTLVVTIGSGEIEAPVSPPTSVCERGTIFFSAYATAP